MQTTAVYACVRILAEAIASIPLHVYKYNAEGNKERVADHSLYYLLHDEPNPEMTSFVFRETLMSHLLLWGNAYAQVIRDGRGRVLALYPLLPSKMTVSRDKNSELVYSYCRDAEESRANPESGTVTLRRDEVLHILGLGFDGLVGYSPIAMSKNAIGMALATEEYGASFFSNGANPSGVLEHPGTIKDIQRVKESWNAAYQGANNARKVAVVLNALQIGTDSEGGYLVPDEFESTLIHALEEENIVRQLATVITTGGDRKIPVFATKGTASWVNEEGAVPESDDTFSQVSLGAFKLVTMIKVSQELLNDSAFNLESYIAKAFAGRIGIREEEGFPFRFYLTRVYLINRNSENTCNRFNNAFLIFITFIMPIVYILIKIHIVAILNRM